MARAIKGSNKKPMVLSIQYLDLPFGLAQGGELVEPFRISIFEF